MEAHDEMSRRSTKSPSFNLHVLQGDGITRYGYIKYKHAAFICVNVLRGMDYL